MRSVMVCLSALTLAACAGAPPDDPVQGVGFGNYDDYLAQQQRAREAELRGQQGQTVLPPVRTEDDEASDIARAAVIAVGGDVATDGEIVREVGQDTGAAGTETAALEPIDPDNPSISDEQDFEAVSNRRSIESDAARLQNRRQQYTVIEPTALPRRPGSIAPTPIEFALQTSHPVGSKQYSRSGFGAGRVAEKCAEFRSAEQAQDAFLKQGGPRRDRLGLDPDGDGYACAWNPAKYRSVSRN
ncbi:MAG: hypothetical protein AAGA12_14250 [Pseudomonadota bacterium]